MQLLNSVNVTIVTTMEISMEILRKLKIEIALYLAFLLLGISLEELKTSFYSDPCTPMYVAARFIIAKTWKWPTYSSADEWMEKNVFTHSGVLLCHKE